MKAPPTKGNKGIWKCPEKDRPSIQIHRGSQISEKPGRPGYRGRPGYWGTPGYRARPRHRGRPGRHGRSGSSSGSAFGRQNRGLGGKLSHHHSSVKAIRNAGTKWGNSSQMEYVRQKDEEFLLGSKSETFMVSLPRPANLGKIICGTQKWQGLQAPACFNLCCDTVYARTAFCRSSMLCF